MWSSVDKKINPTPSIRPYMKYYISMAFIIPITIVLTFILNADIIPVKNQYAPHILLTASSIINIILYKKGHDLQHNNTNTNDKN